MCIRDRLRALLHLRALVGPPSVALPPLLYLPSHVPPWSFAHCISWIPLPPAGVFAGGGAGCGTDERSCAQGPATGSDNAAF
eukprot:7464999-Alexandrium_andersonii.AAC.1